LTKSKSVSLTSTTHPGLVDDSALGGRMLKGTAGLRWTYRKTRDGSFPGAVGRGDSGEQWENWILLGEGRNLTWTIGQAGGNSAFSLLSSDICVIRKKKKRNMNYPRR